MMKYILLSLIFITLSGVVNAKNTNCDNIEISTQYELEQAIKVCEEEVEKTTKDGKIFFQLGKLYYKKKDYTHALKWFKKAAEQNNLEAMYLVGKIYYNYKYKKQNIDKAVQWFKKAAKDNHTVALFDLGIYYRYSDPKKAFFYFHRAAENGYPRACFWTGNMYKKGEGVERNEKLAIDWYTKGAKLDDFICQEELAILYFRKALKIESDYKRGLRYSNSEIYYEKAVYWAKKVAWKGSVVGQEIVADLNYKGKGGLSKNYNEALYWYKKASEVSNWRGAENRLKVGKMYMNGLGTKKDYILAYAWINSALERGSEFVQEDGLNLLNYLEQRMTKGQIAYAQSIDPIKVMKKKKSSNLKKNDQGTTGTGFFVNNTYLLTNNHVVKECKRIELRNVNYKSETHIITQDVQNDLAVLKADKKNNSYLMFKAGRGVRVGEEIVVLGYPLGILLGSGIKLTSGNISGLTGLINDTTKVQLTAPVQPGNSGGPLLDRSGNVVGVIVARLEKGLSGRNAQNVNLAIKSNVAQMFLDTNNIDYEVKMSKKKKELPDIAEEAKNAVVQVMCYQ